MSQVRKFATNKQFPNPTNTRLNTKHESTHVEQRFARLQWQWVETGKQKICEEHRDKSKNIAIAPRGSYRSAHNAACAREAGVSVRSVCIIVKECECERECVLPQLTQLKLSAHCSMFSGVHQLGAGFLLPFMLAKRAAVSLHIARQTR